MGTSIARRAPTGKFWRVAKATASRFSSPKNTGQVTAAEVTARYVTALGESSPGSRTSSEQPSLPQILQGAQNLGGFYQKLTLQGLDQTLSEYGLGHLIGSSPLTVISGLVDALTGPGAVLEEAVARSALIDLWAGKLAEAAEDYFSWSNRWRSECTLPTVINQIRHFLAEAVFQKLASDLGEPLEAQAGGAARGCHRRQQLRHFIHAQIMLESDDPDKFDFFWSDQQRPIWISRQLQILLTRLEQGRGR